MIIHPGFLKTATTTLQEHLFAHHPQLWLLGGHCRSDLHRQISSSLRGLDGVDYDAGRLRQLIAVARQEKPAGKVEIMSDETLTANAHLLYPIALRLRSLFPDARILFTIRHQLDAIRSFYARHGRVLSNVPEPYRDRHISLENWLEHAYSNRLTSFLGVIDYHTTIRVYRDVFGADRLHVLLFEQLRHDFEVFVTQLAAILEVDAESARQLLHGKHTHAQESASFVAYDRLRKRFRLLNRASVLLTQVPRLRAWGRRVVERGMPLNIVIPAAWVPKLAAIYHAGNGTLRDSLGLPLDRYNYP